MPKTKEAYSREFFQKTGAEGGKLGGALAWAGLTPEQRSARARASWAQRKWRPYKIKDSATSPSAHPSKSSRQKKSAAL